MRGIYHGGATGGSAAVELEFSKKCKQIGEAVRQYFLN